MSTSDASSSSRTAWATSTSSTSCYSRRKPGKISTLGVSSPWVPPGEGPSSPCVSWPPVGDSLRAATSSLSFPPAEMEGWWWAGEGTRWWKRRRTDGRGVCGGSARALVLIPLHPAASRGAESTVEVPATAPAAGEWPRACSGACSGFHGWGWWVCAYGKLLSEGSTCSLAIPLRPHQLLPDSLQRSLHRAQGELLG